MLNSVLNLDPCDPGYIVTGRIGSKLDCMNKLVILSLISAAVMSCVWDNEDAYYADPVSCDTVNVSFSEDIVPLLVNHCYSCHSNLNAPGLGGGLPLEDHQDVALSAGRIEGAINHREGYQPMPREADKIDPCPIELFEAWINAGTPDN